MCGIYRICFKWATLNSDFLYENYKNYLAQFNSISLLPWFSLAARAGFCQALGSSGWGQSRGEPLCGWLPLRLWLRGSAGPGWSCGLVKRGPMRPTFAGGRKLPRALHPHFCLWDGKVCLEPHHPEWWPWAMWPVNPWNVASGMELDFKFLCNFSVI